MTTTCADCHRTIRRVDSPEALPGVYCTCLDDPAALAESRDADHAEALALNVKVDAVESVGLPMTTGQIAETLSSSFPFPRIDITYNHGD